MRSMIRILCLLSNLSSVELLLVGGEFQVLVLGGLAVLALDKTQRIQLSYLTMIKLTNNGGRGPPRRERKRESVREVVP